MSQTAEEYIHALGWEAVSTLPQDADTRTYTRVRKGKKTALIMDIPRNEHAMLEYVRIGAYMREQGVRVPEIYHAEPQNGLALIEDFGITHMRHALENDPGQASHLYGQAFEILDHFKTMTDLPPLCAYQANAVDYGRRRVIEWYAPAALRHEIKQKDINAYLAAWQTIEKDLFPEPQGFVHADFHVDNLMVLSDGTLGVIDFQDALYGSPLYDLGNLIEDMRINVPPAIHSHALASLSDNQHQTLRVLTTQFHCRLLGQCLMWDIRHGKPQYLAFLPRLESYITHALNSYPLLAPLKEFFDDLGLDFTLSKALNREHARTFINPNAF